MYGIYLGDRYMTWKILFGQTESKLIGKCYILMNSKSWTITVRDRNT